MFGQLRTLKVLDEHVSQGYQCLVLIRLFNIWATMNSSDAQQNLLRLCLCSQAWSIVQHVDKSLDINKTRVGVHGEEQLRGTEDGGDGRILE